MAGDSGMAGKVALLLWAQTLGLAGAQITQLLVYPPWTPAVLWDTVTLTCQGSGTSGATTWHKDGHRWGMEGQDQFIVTESGTYRCHRPGTGYSDTVSVSDDPLVLQVSTRVLLEGDRVTLRCRLRSDSSFTAVSLYRAEGTSELLHKGLELSLSPLQLNHSGHYSCRGHFGFATSHGTWSQPVTVTVRELFSVPLLEGPPEVIVGSPLNLSCLSTPSPLRPPAPLLHLFYRDGQLVGGPRVSPQLLVPAVGVSHSGNYSCEVRSEGGAVRKSSARLRVTVRVPVANVTITPGPPAHQVHAGDPVTLRCSVQVGSAPVTFTWLSDGQEVARGAVLELGDTDVGHSGTYQCVATIELDGHPEFRAVSPELALEVTPRGPWGTAVAVNVGRTLLYLLLLVAVIGGCHCWHRTGARKAQDRAPPEPPEEGEVLDTLIEGIERAGGSPGVSPGAAPPRDPQVTKAELSGPCEGQQDPGDSYENVP